MIKDRIYYVIFSYSLIYITMVYFTYLTPLSQDDFVYWPYWWNYPNLKYDLKEVILFQIRHWQHANGRVIAHFILMTLILSTDWLYIFLSPLVFCANIWLGQYLIWGSNWKKYVKIWHPLIIFSFIWIFTPLFGNNYLWRTGTANYLYTTFFALIFIAQYRYLIDNPYFKIRNILIPFWIILSIIAGWTNENLGILVFITSMITTLYIHVKYKISNRLAILGCIFSLAGWLILILSPGAQERIQSDAPNFLKNGIVEHLSNYFSWWMESQINFLPLSIIVIIGIIINYKRIFDIHNIIAIYLYIIAQLSILAFIFSPIFPMHALGNTTLFFSISASYFIFYQYKKFNYLKNCLIIFILIYASKSIINDGIIHFWVQNKTTLRQEYEFHNNKKPIIPNYKNTYSKYFIFEMFPHDKPEFLHEYICKYYHVDDFKMQKPSR